MIRPELEANWEKKDLNLTGENKIVIIPTSGYLSSWVGQCPKHSKQYPFIGFSFPDLKSSESCWIARGDFRCRPKLFPSA
jgi:hypothetical protein